MKTPIFPQDQSFWYLQRPETLPLKDNKEADVVVIGGGMSGLTAAQAFLKKGKKVILIEAFYCGAGATGKSSGFIVPNGELSLSQFIDRYGVEGGKTIWNSIEKKGLEHIRNNIKNYNIDCDYTEQDSLELASSNKDLKVIVKEAENLANFGYSTKFIKKEDLPFVIGSTKYYGGVVYSKTFGINAYKYCQEMKKILTSEGVEIYEETPALNVQENSVTTLHATVKAGHIIVCTDKFIPMLGKLTQEIYHVQNSLLISETLTQDTIQKIFPNERLMTWDTELIYSFYRMTGNRLLLGGGSMLNAYNKTASYNNEYMYKKLTNYLTDKYPSVNIQFEQMWPGLIGISKDIAPLSGRDKNSKSIYYIGAAAGLTLAAMLGNYCADNIIDNDDTLKNYFSPYRKFPISGTLQTILGQKLSFALSNFISL